MRILLLSHFFPPLSTIASHRAYGWARAWAERGHEVHVLTPAKYPIDGPLDLDLPTDGLTIHAVSCWWAGSSRPAARMTRSSARVAVWADLKRRTRSLRHALGLFGDIRMLLVPSLVREGSAILASRPFDLLVSNFGPPSTMISASILARRSGLTWVVDYQDLWSENYAHAGGFFGRRMEAPFERALVRHAAMLVTLSHGLARRLEKALGRKALVAYFGYLEETDNPPAPSWCWADGRMRLVYTGRVYERQQAIMPFLVGLSRALSADPSLADRLCVEFFGPDQAPLREMVATHRLGHVVHLGGRIPQADALAVQRSASALLFLDWIDPATEGVLTGKLFEYLRSRRPIIFVGSGFQTEASHLAGRTGAALEMQGPAQVECFLSKWPHSVPALARDEVFIDALSCRRQAGAVLAEIEARLFPKGAQACRGPTISSTST